MKNYLAGFFITLGLGILIANYGLYVQKGWDFFFERDAILIDLLTIFMVGYSFGKAIELLKEK